MAFKATDEQRLAIDTDGNVLVAAAAGSGKTAVLVERVMRLLTDETAPVGADELLIVTFTNAAAAEMRTRIEKKLAAACAEQPDNRRLREQRHLLPSAKICTIDSFCIDLVRENFERAGVSPDFRVADESSMETLKSAAFSEALNHFFEADPELMRELLDILGADYDDSSIKNAVDGIFKVSRNYPFPETYLNSISEALNTSFNREHPWFAEIMLRAKEQISGMLRAVTVAIELVRQANAKRTAGYSRALGEMSDQLSEMLRLVNSEDLDGLLNAVCRYDHSALNGTSTGGLPELTAVKTIIKENGKTEGKNALSRIVFADTEQINEVCRRLREPAGLLLRIVSYYAEALFSLQQRDNMYTFYNTEQMALSMLCEVKNGVIAPREDISSFTERYSAVLVDEYQDTNDLQDTLFRVLSNNEEHLFAVGDVKQSIYAFRGANPDNFLKKKAAAVSADKAGKGDIKKIVLARNFRSRKGVCDYINFFFSLLMTADNGKLVYDGDERLVPQDAFPPNSGVCAELLVMDRGSAEDTDDGDESAAALAEEARVIADYIKKNVSEEAFLRGDNGLRKARYGDFAILMRNQKNRSAQLAEELRRYGIPVSFSKESFLEALEIKTFCSLLDIIDNPKQDISLLTAMLSPIFGFSAEELARLRSEHPSGDMLSAVTAAAASGNSHAADFLSVIGKMRAEAVTTPLPRLMQRLLAKTDYLNFAAAMADGERRRANLLLLCSYAASYYNGGSGTLGGFLRMLRKIPPDSLKAAKTGGGDNAVRLMSMHTSKGLQFPICIICDLGVDMHNKNEKSNVLFSPRDGIGFKYFDERLSKKCVAPAYRMIGNRLREDRLAEELRLLYVAMTRAEERLVMVSYNRKLEEKLTALSANLFVNNGVIDRSLYKKTASMNDWILMTALLHPDGSPLRRITGIPLIPPSENGRLRVSVIKTVPSFDISPTDGREILPDKALAERIKDNFDFVYPYSPLLEIEAKSTVSRLANSAESDTFSFTSKPSVLEKEGISAAGRGTATHRVMQFIAFDENPDIDAELERLYEWQYISEAQYKAVDKAAINAFFKSDIYKRIYASADVRREMRFLTEIPAGALHSGLPVPLSGEKVVVQGAVDLCFREGDGIVIVDFKTDRVKAEEPLIAAYSEQLRFYADACEKIFALPVKEKILYSFALGKEIRV